jgi:hypothetical protein
MPDAGAAFTLSYNGGWPARARERWLSSRRSAGRAVVSGAYSCDWPLAKRATISEPRMMAP